METSTFDMFAPEMCVDPYPHYRRMREHDPVHRSALGFAMLFRFDDVMTFFTDRSLEHQYALTQQLRGGPESLEQPYYEVFRRMVFVMDNPGHRRVRLLFAKSFTPKQVTRMHDQVRAVAHALIDRVEGQGGMDFVADFATPFPIRVIGELLGVPAADQDRVGLLSRDLNPVLQFLPMSPQVQDRANASVVELVDYFRELTAHKRCNPADDLLTQMIAAMDEHERLDVDELVSNAILLYLAGHETSSGGAGLALLALHRHPGQLRLLRDDPALIPGAVEELLRYDPPGQATARVTTAPISFGEIEIPAGQGVVAWIGAANRDPARYREPDTLDLRRVGESSATFGGGAHYCVGNSLARQELAVVLELLCGRLRTLELLTSDPPFRNTSLMRGLSAAPVSW